MKEQIKLLAIAASLMALSAATFLSFCHFVRMEYENPDPPHGIRLVEGDPRTNDEAHNSLVVWSRTSVFACVGKIVVGGLIVTPSLIAFLLVLYFVKKSISRVVD